MPQFQSAGSLESVILRTCWETISDEMTQVVNLVGSLGPLRWHNLWVLIWRGRMRRLIQAQTRSSGVSFFSLSSFSMYVVIAASITNMSGEQRFQFRQASGVPAVYAERLMRSSGVLLLT